MTDISARPVEVELKFRMTDVATGERLLLLDDLDGFSAIGPSIQVLNEDRYLDTPDAALAGAGYAGRLRQSADGTVITLKGLRRPDEGGATHRREELEGSADPGVPPAKWPQSEARDAIVAIAGDRSLVELVVLRQTRRKRLYGRDATVVELSVDDVEVLAGDRVIDRFAELEAELRSGEESALEPLAELFNAIEELIPAETSKLERALFAIRREHAAEEAMREAGPGDEDDGRNGTDRSHSADTGSGMPADGTTDDDAPAAVPVMAVEATPQAPEATTPERVVADGAPADRPAKADAAPEEPAPQPRLTAPKTPGVVAEDHLAEAGRKVLRFHLARMVAREEGTRTGRDPEELHGMRVATRRQRAAWRVFGAAFDQDRTRRHQRRLKAVARDLGGVRDMDVLIEAAEAYQRAQSAAEAAAFEPLVATWRGQRDAARAVLLRGLDSNRYQRWVNDYIAFVQAEGEGALTVGPVQPHRVRDTMPSRIWAAYEGVRAYESVMRWADVQTLHDLRIAAKWLRYTLEFVREALGRDAGPVIEKVVALQDHLGWLHDADVAAGLARGFLVEHAGDLSEHESAAIGRYLVDRERELARLRRTVGPAWRGVSSLAFRRALGRVVAGL
jgi:CHAD domain-containing protein